MTRSKSQSGTHHLNWSDWAAGCWLTLIGPNRSPSNPTSKQTSYHVFFSILSAWLTVFCLIRIEPVLCLEYTSNVLEEIGDVTVAWIVFTGNAFFCHSRKCYILVSHRNHRKEVGMDGGWYKMQDFDNRHPACHVWLDLKLLKHFG